MGTYEGKMGMSGSLGIKVIRAADIRKNWNRANRRRPTFWKGVLSAWLAQKFTDLTGCPVLVGSLELVLIKRGGRVIPLGLASRRVITTAFVSDMVDELIAETSGWGDYKYHDSGVGGTGEDVGDTDIETTDGESRVAGTQAEDAANIYETVATISYTSTKAIVEHGVMNESTGGTLMDRSVFSVVNVVNGDSIQFTYKLTCTAGS